MLAMAGLSVIALKTGIEQFPNAFLDWPLLGVVINGFGRCQGLSDFPEDADHIRVAAYAGFIQHVLKAFSAEARNHLLCQFQVPGKMGTAKFRVVDGLVHPFRMDLLVALMKSVVRS